MFFSFLFMHVFKQYTFLFSPVDVYVTGCWKMLFSYCWKWKLTAAEYTVGLVFYSNVPSHTIENRVKQEIMQYYLVFLFRTYMLSFTWTMMKLYSVMLTKVPVNLIYFYDVRESESESCR